MSSLYRRNKIYWLSFRRYGKAYCRSLKTKDRSTALYHKAEIDKELIEGRYVLPQQSAECAPLLISCLAFNEHRRSPRFNAGCKARISRFLAWSKALRVNQITEGRFQDYLNSRIGVDKVTAYEANNIIVAVKGWLNWCVRTRKIAENPLRDVKKFKTPETTRRFLSKDEISRILKAARDPRIYADRKPVLLPMIATAIYAGLRKQELLNLEWSDIDFQRNTLTVSNKVDFTTKSKKNRTIPLHPDLKTILAPLRRDKGKCFDMINQRRVFRRITKAAKLPGIMLHELRHTFASQALMAGVPVPTVSKWLGHASLATTQLYSHLSRSHEQEEITRLRF